MKQKMKEHKGITLVALILTIIVLLILAVVAISAVKGDGIISHAKNARSQYSGAQTNEQDMLSRYEYELEKAQEKTDSSYEQYMWDEAEKNGVVPQGAVYKTGYVWDENNYVFNDSNVVTLNPGDKLPTEPKIGDSLVFGDYMYAYSSVCYPGGTYSYDDGSSNAVGNNEMWGVMVNSASNNKIELGNILTNILGKKIGPNMSFTWYDSHVENLIIPDGCRSYDGSSCVKKVTIPNTLTNLLHGCFASVEEIYYKGSKTQWESFMTKTCKDMGGYPFGQNQNFIIHYNDGKTEKIKAEYGYDSTNGEYHYKLTYTEI